jgi:hypothetical protein
MKALGMIGVKPIPDKQRSARSKRVNTASLSEGNTGLRLRFLMRSSIWAAARDASTYSLSVGNSLSVGAEASDSKDAAGVPGVLETLTPEYFPAGLRGLKPGGKSAPRRAMRHRMKYISLPLLLFRNLALSEN